MGRDNSSRLNSPTPTKFQSTLPAWGETWPTAWVRPPAKDFNPLSPHGERLLKGVKATKIKKFQSTLPAWGETIRRICTGGLTIISIHSPRMGRDTPTWGWEFIRENFNPLSPHGERPNCGAKMDGEGDISIHSPRMGRDYMVVYNKTRRKNFNPLSPHGERRLMPRTAYPHKIISIHSPRMGRDQSGQHQFFQLADFNPLSPHGERPYCCGSHSSPSWNFNPLSPHGERLNALVTLIMVGNFNPLSPHGERLGLDMILAGL